MKRNQIASEAASQQDSAATQSAPRMKKGWKIALISLGSLLGLIVITLVVACWLLFTPARLTPIVNKLADKFILCENHFESVNLSLFKTYPNVGLEVNDVTLINPYQLPEGNALAAKCRQNDTLAHIGSLTVGIDLKAFLHDRSIIVRQLRLDDVQANLYTAPDGWSNLDIFPPSTDTTESETSLPENIQLEKIAINNLSAQYCDLQQQMLARADTLNMKLKGSLVKSDVDADLTLDGGKLLVDMRDSLGREHLLANVLRPDIRLKGKGSLDKIIAGALNGTDADADLSLKMDQLLVDMRDSLGRKMLYANMTKPDLSLDGSTAVAQASSGSLKGTQLDANLLLMIQKAVVDMRDSSGRETLVANLIDPEIKLNAKGLYEAAQGCLWVDMPNGRFVLNGDEFVTKAMQESRHDILSVVMPYKADLDRMAFTLLDGTCLSLAGYVMDLQGDVALANDTLPMQVDAQYSLKDWQVGDLLAILPPFITQSLKGMDIDAKASIKGTAKGAVADGRLPLVHADVTLQKGSFSAPEMLPMPVKDINAHMVTDLNLSSSKPYKGASDVNIEYITAKAKKSSLRVTGKVNDLLGDDMLIDAAIKGDLSLPDLEAFLPDTMPISLEGTSKVDLKVKSLLSAITDLRLDKVKASGTLDMRGLDVTYDSLHASSPSLSVALALPAKKQSSKVAELLGAHIVGGELNVQMDNMALDAHVSDPDIRVGMPNILDEKQPLAAAFDIKFSRVNAEMDSMLILSDTLKLKGSFRNDATQSNPLKQWNPDVDIDLLRGVFSMPSMSEAVRIPSFLLNYKPEVCDISQADILWGVSDYHLHGKVYGLENWLSHKAMLQGHLNFNANYADIDQLMGILSGMGSDPDTLEQQRVEDNVPKEANPFIVPKDVDVKLNTHISRCVAFGNDLSDLSGSVTVNDGVAVLEQIGFTCKAARMQLTGVYKSPRVNHLFAGLDFHLLDIDIEELIDMVPMVDTLVPMLSAFAGKADFHLAGECNLDAYYHPKFSTLIGAGAISGKDLVVLDNHTVATLAKLLQLKKMRDKDDHFGLDSLSVEATVFRKEIIVYPFLLGLNNYQLCVGGRHTLDNACNYHAELIRCPLPMRLAVDVSGTLSEPKIALGKVQYAEMYKPEKRDDLQTRTLEIKRLVREALEKNVKQSSSGMR